MKMNSGFIIKVTRDQGCRLTVNPKKATDLGLGNRKFAWIRFGNNRQYVQIVLDRENAPEHLGLSPDLIKALSLPDYPVYEVAYAADQLIIGPYIGLLAVREEQRLTGRRLRKMTACLKEYAGLHGAVVVFALDQVDRKRCRIEGYCYNPATNSWQKGVFPYPAAICRSIGLSPEWKNHFGAVIGDTMFNSSFFSKWQMHQWFSEVPEVGCHLPNTVLYNSPQDALAMLERFAKVYIKPILGLQGRGILRMSKEDQRIIASYREGKVNQTIVFAHPGQAGEYLRGRLRPGKYLIQQGIDLLQYEEGVLDFRCVVQKNQANCWICQAIIGRVGESRSVVSNISNGGSAFTIDEILPKVILAAEEHIRELINEIATLAVVVCNKLGEFGVNCGSLGLDIGIDTEERLWLFEINNRDPDPGIALDINDRQLYQKIMAGPLYYAKYLAGFPAPGACDD
jgi:glutathione synthase/RimK-type ligase-like ATP-grasp enzyme